MLLTIRDEWSYRVSVNDKTFSTFLEPYLELGEDIPKELELSGSVADIILTGWSDYELLLELIQEAESQTLPKKAKGLMYEVHIDTLQPFTNVPIHNTLYPLSRILNLPEGWEKYAMLSGNEPESERLIHTRAQGRAMMAARPGLTFVKYSDTELFAKNKEFISLLHYVADELIRKIRRLYKDKNERDERVKDLEAVFYGIVRNVFLRGYDGSSWEDFNWKDLLTLIQQLEPTIKLKNQAIYLLAGVGVHSPESVGNYVMYNPPSDIQGFDRIRGWHNLYHHVLQLIPDYVDTLYLGLADVVSAAGRYADFYRIMKGVEGHSPIHHVVLHTHNLLIRHYQDVIGNYNMSRSDLRKLVVFLSHTFIGKEGLRRILLSLLHQVSRDYDERADDFAAVIEEYLDSDEANMIREPVSMRDATSFIKSIT